MYAQRAPDLDLSDARLLFGYKGFDEICSGINLVELVIVLGGAGP